jgi:hypothetical protein
MTGSYLGLEADWKERVVFTPDGVTTPDQIYLIDKLIYAFPFHPLIGTACIVSFLILIGIIIFAVINKFRHTKQLRKEMFYQDSKRK